MAKRPLIVPKPIYLSAKPVLVAAVLVFMGLWVYRAFWYDPYQKHLLQLTTTSGQQNAAKLEANGLSSVGPNPSEVAKGKATPPPVRVSPTTPATVYVTGARGRQGPGPTSAQIGEAVSAYFAQHPPQANVTVSQLTPIVKTYVTSYLRGHPIPTPSPGKEGKQGPSGSPGAPGSPGPGPTQEQINAAVQAYLPGIVSAYLTANPPPSGPPGTNGTNGTNGTDGTDGTNGKPPFGWSYTDPGTGTEMQCLRDNTNDNQPHYTCAPASSTTTIPPGSATP